MRTPTNMPRIALRKLTYSAMAIALCGCVLIASSAAQQTAPPPAQQPAQPIRQPNRGPQLPVRNLSAPRGPAGQAAPEAIRVDPVGGRQPSVGGPPSASRAVQPAQAIGPPRAGTARISGPPVPTQPAAAQAPFRLTPQQQLALDKVLTDWQMQSQAIKSFTCTLTRWEIDEVFKKETIGVGELKYRAPDHGLYRVKDKKTDEWIEHWVCDGESIFEYNYVKKELVQRVLPLNMRGKAISDGPLPFIFGADAAKLKQRYWMRLREPPPGHDDKVCIEAFPRMQQDAANFRRAELLLSPRDMSPFALQIDLTNSKNFTVHRFDSIVTNDPLRGLKDIFTAPRAYPGWKKIVVDSETVDPDANRGPAANQARGPTELPR